MSFKAVLYIENQERILINSELVYSQLADINGRPTQLPMGEPLHLVFPSNAQDELFYEYMFAPNRMCKGYIRVFKRDGLQKDFDIEFANAHIIGLKEHFSSTGKEPMSMALTISYGISRVKGVIHEKKWNPSNPFKISSATPIQRKTTLEPTVEDGYFTTLKGDRIPKSELKTGIEVYYVLETQNAIGEFIDLDLADAENDFKYNGEIVPNDVLEDLQITGNSQKIKLEVIRQQN
ncbi:hypothetical protein D1816_08550 [Aquimarina sp. AD10]|uniref:type VI secretion system tube protein TssD n=1 Tax=Aquimarina sp. AD10 TaxID=1714849 RepID=UPI000E4E2203|nr:type VI secretion system tube protein TssD [Aquimarina sp. AD10]AXT60396.1 hypothetical protein D1816_08550 [Aquimarina sp. AD10]RKN01169.1 hypothetical protein D7033_04935 [Aquimarina sp. AD10]